VSNAQSDFARLTWGRYLCFRVSKKQAPALLGGLSSFCSLDVSELDLKRPANSLMVPRRLDQCLVGPCCQGVVVVRRSIRCRLLKEGDMTNFVRNAAASAFLLMVPLSSTFAQTATAADVQNAQNQATIATSNATAATAAATLANAQASAQLANQKNDIANIQAALQAPDPSKLRMNGTLAAPNVTATNNYLLSTELQAWLNDTKDAHSPVQQLVNCKSIFLSRPSLATLTLAYKATDGKLKAIWAGLDRSTKDLRNAIKPEEGGAPRKAEIAALPAIAGADALANLVLSVAAAAKQQTAIGTQAISPANKILTAAVSEKVSGLGKPFYDADIITDVSYGDLGNTAACAATTATELASLTLTGKAVCVGAETEKAQSAADDAQAYVAEAAKKLQPLDPSSKKPDPDAKARAALDALMKRIDVHTKLLTQSKTDFQGLFTADASSGAIPFNSALQGEAYHSLLSGDGSCMLALSAISSDADTVVRDGTFSSYKLSIATTTTISWTISGWDGKIQRAGFKVLADKWARQALGE